MSNAVTVEAVSKRYRLYHERNQSLKSAVMRGRRARFEELWALSDVSLSIAKGQTYGLIGHNGSGKSTLLKCIAKILRPDKGRIATDGKISALLELGAGFHPELSGKDNVYLNGSILGLSKKEIDARFDGIVDFSGLGGRIDTPVKNYSSGMYIRLAFAVAINVDPEILLVDEILTVGDEEFQRRCTQKFDDLKDAGKTIVIVSHGLGSIKDMCDEVALLDHGQVKAIGKAEEVIEKYLGGVEKNARPDGEYGLRFGEGGASIDRVEILDDGLKPTSLLRTGDRATFRIHFSTERRIENPVWKIEVTNRHGMVLGGSNNRYHRLVPASVEGEGVVEYYIPKVFLVPGVYDLSCYFFDYDLKRPYDARIRFMRFEVEEGYPPDYDGVFSIGGNWVGDFLPYE